MGCWAGGNARHLGGTKGEMREGKLVEGECEWVAWRGERTRPFSSTATGLLHLFVGTLLLSKTELAQDDTWYGIHQQLTIANTYAST